MTATGAVIMSVDAHCLTSSTASALSAVSVALSGEVTNRLSDPLGQVLHGKMARLTAGNGKNGRAGMASDAGLRGGMRTPGQISRRGCLFALLALVITAAMLTWAALFALHRIFPAPPAVWSAGGEQFAQLSSLQGTWQDSAGGKMIFTGPRFTAAASGGIIAGGTVTFVDVPQVFSWAAGPPPPSYGHGTWQVGTSSRSMMGLQHQPDAGIISIQFGTGTQVPTPWWGWKSKAPPPHHRSCANTRTRPIRARSGKSPEGTATGLLTTPSQLQQGTARF